MRYHPILDTAFVRNLMGIDNRHMMYYRTPPTRPRTGTNQFTPYDII